MATIVLLKYKENKWKGGRKEGRRKEEERKEYVYRTNKWL